MNDWQAQQQVDELLHQREIVESLKAARAAGTPDDVIDLLAYECGVRDQYRKEVQ